MKKKIFSAVLIVAGLLSGCSSEEVVSTPETIGQAGALTFSFPVPRQSVTYAIPGGTAAETGVPATEDEIRINDVTVYMFRNSDEGNLVARKTASPDEVGERKVTFDVNRFAAAGSDDYIFYAVANANGNITDNFVVGSTTLDDFTSAVATGTGTDPVPGSHMLMVGYVAIDALSAQTDPVQSINLRHRVARFDIDNLTSDGDPANNNLESTHDDYNADETFFEITKIHILNTRSSGYLTAETNGQARTPVSGRVSFKGDNAIDVSGISGINEVPVEGVFYLWPGVLSGEDHYLESDSTVIEVEGIYTGDGKAELFTVLLESEKTIEANKRYTLKVQRISHTTLTLELFASDWGVGDAVIAIPVSDGSLAYGGFELLVGGADESVPLAATTVDLSGNTGDNDNELRFYTESDSKATGDLTVDLALTLGAGYDHVVTPVPDGDPVVTYSIGKVRQYYKITLPKTTYPVSGTLTIKDENTQQEQELVITSVPVYENTVKPVLVSGDYGSGTENRYWAPVNVGATSTTYSADLAGCGYYFQWGRNVPFIYNSANDKYEGPVSAADAETTYADKFITNTSTETFNDWLAPQDSFLWSGENSRGPCPAGWRVPTETELLVLKNKIGSVSSNRVSVTGVGGTLYLPAAGRRDNTGEWGYQGANGRYWSSSVDGTSARSLYFASGSPTMNSYNRAYGISVRCIQE
ncbi:MAG: FimB/Mfa2 family fimbrial subunit [Prevotella sp.]|jgi:uncharacterized protein (TIGR02145 family)|nr:FimB/Mfa2 family fimbrial subunit [Prevotella sp.]